MVIISILGKEVVLVQNRLFGIKHHEVLRTGRLSRGLVKQCLLTTAD